jgi:toxin ParE1/3/4
MARIVRSSESKADVQEIACYIAQDNLDAALRFFNSVDEKLKLLAAFPGAGTARDELALGLRSFPVGSYLILYEQIKGDGIKVVRILHGARNLRKSSNVPSGSELVCGDERT